MEKAHTKIMNKKFFWGLIVLSFFFFCIYTKNEITFAKNQSEQCEVFLCSENKKINLDLSKFEHNSKIHTIIWPASMFSRKSSNKQKAKTILNFFEATNDIEKSFEMVMPGIKNEMDEIEKQINTSSINAQLVLKNEKFNIIDGKNAKNVDRKGLFFKILSFLQNSDTNEIEIPTKIETPKITKTDLQNCTNLRATFQTDFSNNYSYLFVFFMTFRQLIKQCKPLKTRLLRSAKHHKRPSPLLRSDYF